MTQSQSLSHRQIIILPLPPPCQKVCAPATKKHHAVNVNDLLKLQVHHGLSQNQKDQSENYKPITQTSYPQSSVKSSVGTFCLFVI